MKNSTKSILNRVKYPNPSRLVKEAIILIWIQLLVISPNHAGFWKKAEKPQKANEPISLISNKKILKDSTISYRATGGFTGVKSFNVIMSCKDGKISLLKTIHNPLRNRRRPTLRERGRMDYVAYLRLWEYFQKQQIFKVKDAPEPKRDIVDEFTFHFEVRIGKKKNTFKIYGISRPEAARYFAFKNLIDQASDMASLWDQHGALAKK